jgi:predicted SprT family Zn-dependent metalloprotease
MTKADMEVICRVALHSAWARLEMLYGNIGDVPEIRMNTHTWRTAGRAWLENNTVEVSAKLFPHHQEEFMMVTIPHEAIHHVAWRLAGDGGHGKAWKQMMRDFGLEPTPYHNMEMPK